MDPGGIHAPVTAFQLGTVQTELIAMITEMGQRIAAHAEELNASITQKVDEKFASASAGFDAEQKRMNDTVESLKAMISSTDNAKLEEVGTQLVQLGVREETRTALLKSFITDESTNLRRELMSTNATLSDITIKFEKELKEFQDKIQQQPQPQHFQMSGDSGQRQDRQPQRLKIARPLWLQARYSSWAR